MSLYNNKQNVKHHVGRWLFQGRTSFFRNSGHQLVPGFFRLRLRVQHGFDVGTGHFLRRTWDKFHGRSRREFAFQHGSLSRIDSRRRRPGRVLWSSESRGNDHFLCSRRLHPDLWRSSKESCTSAHSVLLLLWRKWAARWWMKITWLLWWDGNYISRIPTLTPTLMVQHSSSAMGLIQSTFRAAKKKCQLTLAHEKFQWMHSFLAAPKSSQYIEEINREFVYWIAGPNRKINEQL